MLTDLDRLLRVFDAYCAATGRAEATVSTRFLGGGGRISSLRETGDMGARLIARTLQDFAAHWPPGAAWPAEVPLPVVDSLPSFPARGGAM